MIAYSIFLRLGALPILIILSFSLYRYKFRVFKLKVFYTIHSVVKLKLIFFAHFLNHNRDWDISRFKIPDIIWWYDSNIQRVSQFSCGHIQDRSYIVMKMHYQFTITNIGKTYAWPLIKTNTNVYFKNNNWTLFGLHIEFAKALFFNFMYLMVGNRFVSYELIILKNKRIFLLKIKPKKTL